MKVLDLFSGIGGFSLGLERAGMQTVAFCEIEPFPRKVLRKHWPDVPIYDDVRTLTAERLASDGVEVDLICGGFPCQDISIAGKGAGLSGERSGLWREYSRLIGEIRPRYVIVENVAALLHRGLGDVLGDLAALGYDAEWHCIPASTVGAPHRRDRIWIVAHSDGQRELQPEGGKRDKWGWLGVRSEDLANPYQGDGFGGSSSLQMGRGWLASQIADDGIKRGIEWSIEPDVGRVAHGVSNRVDRLGGLGNAVVPQIPELIGRAIMAAEGRA